MASRPAYNQEKAFNYRMLKRYERELRQSGCDCSYQDKAVRSNQPDAFSVSFSHLLRGDSSETSASVFVRVLNPETKEVEEYHFCYGVERIKALYGNEGHKKEETDNAWLITQIERHVKYKDDDADRLFLHHPDGTLFPTIQTGGMEKGQIYAYNEMKYIQGKNRPMIRIGPRNEYIEFLPGMSVRFRDGRIFVQRPLSS